MRKLQSSFLIQALFSASLLGGVGAASLPLLASAQVLPDGEAIEVTRDEVEAESTPSVMVSSEDVAEASDLKAYAYSAMRADRRIAGLLFSDKRVEVKYAREGSLLGLVPITFLVRAIAHADGTSELVYPWFSAITIDNKDEVSAMVDVAVRTALAERLVGSVVAEGEPEDPRLTAPESAKLAEAIQEALRTGIEVSSGAGTTSVGAR